MQRVIGGRSAITQEVQRLLSQYHGTVVAPYVQRDEKKTPDARLVEARSSREQLAIVAEMISGGREPPSVVLIGPKTFSVYDLALMEVCRRYDLPAVVVTLSATPLDTDYNPSDWKEWTVNGAVAARGKTLIITTEEQAQKIKNDWPKVFWVPPFDKQSFTVVASGLTEKNTSARYDNVLVVGDSDLPRSIYEYSLYRSLARNVYYENAKEPTEEFYLVNAHKQTDDCCLLISQFLMKEELPQSLVERLGPSYSFLYSTGLLDRYGVLTASGRRVVQYGIELHAATFLERWIESQEPTFPGIVIAAWLDEVPSSLVTCLEYWNNLVLEVRSSVLLANKGDEERVIQFTQQRETFETSKVLQICNVVKRLVAVLKVNLFGLFHADEAINRSREILTAVYAQDERFDHGFYSTRLGIELVAPVAPTVGSALPALSRPVLF